MRVSDMRIYYEIYLSNVFKGEISKDIKHDIKHKMMSKLRNEDLYLENCDCEFCLNVSGKMGTRNAILKKIIKQHSKHSGDIFMESLNKLS